MKMLLRADLSENVTTIRIGGSIFEIFSWVPPAGAVLWQNFLMRDPDQCSRCADLTGVKAVTLPNYKWNEPFSEC
jgi:hypothetical protein